MKKRDKNRVFALILVLLFVFLAVIWSREKVYRSRLSRVNAVVARLETRLHLLRLRTEALKQEMELLNLSTYMRLIEKLEKKDGKNQGR